MALGIYTSAAFTTASGIAVAANADVEVRRESDSGLASIYSDRAGTTPITQPGFQADASGRFEFYAAGISGGYQVTVDSGAESHTLRYQRTGTAGELDADAFWAAVLATATAAAARLALGFAAIAAKGDRWFGSAADTIVKKAAPANGRIPMADSAQADGWQDVPLMPGFKNLLINPDGGVYQRAVAATADDAYFADRWYALTQTGTVTPSVLSDPEDGYPKGARITQSQASAQRFGFAQIVEGINCKHLRGQSGVLVPRVRISNSQAIRYAILGWTSTEDSVTSDVVNDWTSATYSAGNFFLAANLSVLAVGAQTPSANVWTSLAALSVALGSAFNNIVVMVWTEGTAAQNVTLDFDHVQFERGTVPTEPERRPMSIEEHACFRYYESFGGISFPGIGSAQVSVGWHFKARKRVTPTIGGTNTGGLAISVDVTTSTPGVSTAASFNSDSTASAEL